MKKLILAVTVLALSAGITMGADLVAGNPKNPPANVVGQVNVSIVGSDLVVQYLITEPDWIITETHLHIATDPGDFPMAKGGPPPGQFDYSTSHEVADGETEVIYTIPLVDILGDPVPDPLPILYIAAHAVVGTLCPCDSDPCEDLDLPTDVMVSVLWAGDPGVDDDSYFDATIFGGTSLDGLYDAWCVDTDRSIRPVGLGRGIPLQAYVYCDCYDMPVLLPPDNPLVEYCENIPKVNWILNNVYVGQDIDEINPDNTCDDPGIITYGDIQRAIWELVDDDEGVSGLGVWDQCRVDEIIAAADGEFMPICGEDIGVIILPYVYMIDTTLPPDGTPDVVLVDIDDNPIYSDFPPDVVPILVYVQPIIIRIPVPCCFCDETAWAGTPDPSDNVPGPEPNDGDGYKYEFPGNNWAMYITYPEDAVIVAPVTVKGKK